MNIVQLAKGLKQYYPNIWIVEDVIAISNYDSHARIIEIKEAIAINLEDENTLVIENRSERPENFYFYVKHKIDEIYRYTLTAQCTDNIVSYLDTVIRNTF